jgi:hypothetical protein
MTAAAIQETARKQAEIGPVLARFEVKYTIPFSLVGPISAFIEPYCSLDKYSEQSPDLYYGINSLYFDTPDFLFLRNRVLRVERRFNMRIRSYGSEPQPPYFMEIKQRLSDVVKKFRAKVHTTDLEALCHCTDDHCADGDKNDRNRALFCHTRRRYNAHPAVLVQYRRKAYISDYDEYARVTFDIGLRYMPQREYLPVPVECSMVPCDVQTGFDPGTNVILELKCYTEYVPLWMVDLVRAFQLKRRGFSKYATCLRPLFERFRYDPAFAKNSAIFNQLSEDDAG